jgi:Txe/YoeB family toxin of Txe-Axe toxin-antitoxin module
VAAAWHAALLRRINELTETAKVWPIADEAAVLGVNLQEMLFRRYRHVYRLLYRVRGNTVRIYRVRSASQDRLTPEDLR